MPLQRYSESHSFRLQDCPFFGERRAGLFSDCESDSNFPAARPPKHFYSVRYRGLCLTAIFLLGPSPLAPLALRP